MFDVKALAIANLVAQLLLLGVVLVGAHLARNRKDFRRHCTVMRIAVGVQLATIAAVMYPSLLGYLEHEKKGIVFNSQLLTHHSIGLVVVGLWVFANLAVGGVIKFKGRLRNFMRGAFVLWMAALLIGLATFVQVYLLA